MWIHNSDTPHKNGQGHTLTNYHWVGGSHTELTVSKNRTGYHNHFNSEELTELIRELALVCED